MKVQGSGVRIKIASNIDYNIKDRPIIERWIEGLCWQIQGLATEGKATVVLLEWVQGMDQEVDLNGKLRFTGKVLHMIQNLDPMQVRSFSSDLADWNLDPMRESCSYST